MDKQDKELLLKDLCARLPYGVIFKRHVTNDSWKWRLVGIDDYKRGMVMLKPVEDKIIERPFYIEDKVVQPYLRPMSSMTDEEFGFLQEHLPYDFTRVYSGKFDLINDIHVGNSISIDDIAFLLDCLNKWHFDYRGLIPMDFALPAPEGMYDFK